MIHEYDDGWWMMDDGWSIFLIFLTSCFKYKSFGWCFEPMHVDLQLILWNGLLFINKIQILRASYFAL